MFYYSIKKCFISNSVDSFSPGCEIISTESDGISS